MKSQKEKGFRLIEKAEQYAKESYQIIKSVSSRRLRNKTNTSAKKAHVSV